MRHRRAGGTTVGKRSLGGTGRAGGFAAARSGAARTGSGVVVAAVGLVAVCAVCVVCARATGSFAARRVAGAGAAGGSAWRGTNQSTPANTATAPNRMISTTA
jgi:hypothetical protein